MNSFLLILHLGFLILFLTPTLAQTNPKSDSELPPKLAPNSTSISPQLKPESVSNSTSPHEKLTPESHTKPKLDSKSTSTEPVSNSTSPHEKLTPESHTKPTLDSKSTSTEPVSNSTSPQKKPEEISNSTSSHKTISNSTSPHTKPTLDSRSTSPDPVSTSISPHTNPTSESHKKPTPNSNSTSTEPASNSSSSHNHNTKPTLDSDSTSPHTKSSQHSKSTLPHTGPTLEANSSSPLTKTPANSNKASPLGKQVPHSKSTPSVQGKSKPMPPKSKSIAAPKTKPKNVTSPYQFANHFCLGRRLDVTATFCLQVLRSSAVSTKAEDNQALLAIAADAAIKFGRNNIALLKKLTTGRKARQADLNTAVGECAAAYGGYLKQFQTLAEEAAVEAQLASYDSELAKLEIGRCIKAVKGAKNAEIKAANKAALEYASLAQNIADSIQ